MENYVKLYSPLTNFKIKGVAKKTLEKLNNVGIDTLYDLLYYFPRAYEDRTNLKNIVNLKDDEFAVVRGRVLSLVNRKFGYKKMMTVARISDGSGIMECVWFNLPQIKYTMTVDAEYYFIGKIKKKRLPQIITPEYKLIKRDAGGSSVDNTRNSGGISNSDGNREELYVDGILEGIVPIYSLTKGISQGKLRSIIRNTVDSYSVYLKENIPDVIRKKYKMLERVEAVKKIHFPKSSKDIEDAKQRFAVEELLVLMFGILEKKYALTSALGGQKVFELQDNKTLVKKYLSNLKFDLTRAQKKVISEIYSDLNSGKICNRLLQGDVGSGKTVVAMVILLYMIENSYQGAIMAPTEILATQHYLSVRKVFEELGVKVGFLSGSVKGKARKEVLEELSNGTIDLIVGTHALIEDSVVFKKLGLIVIDEQHRFGVEQRNKIRAKGEVSNLLVMSATPIPRSLALSIYGDLDVSIIDEYPAGRIPIRTKWLRDKSDIDKAISYTRSLLKAGQQVYVVAPLIEESEKMDLMSVAELHSEIEGMFSDYRVGVLHGKLKNSEKDGVMNAFKENRIQILVSTTVVEVGVDVPNATVMVICSAERFGLSALHQLRGRVGRGQKASSCFLISETDNENSTKRLNILEETIDGFKIAEEDLKLRNTGELFGTKQSGVSDMKFVNLVHDIKTIKLAREVATRYLEDNLGTIGNPYMRYDIDIKFSKNES